MKARQFREERIMEDVKKIQIEAVEGKAQELKRQTRLFQKGKNLFKIGFWDRRKLKVDPEHSYIITMFFSNGTMKSWILRTKKHLFKVGKKEYYIFYEESYFDITCNQFHLFYHEEFSVPINRECVKIGDEAYFAVTPENLKDFIEMNYVKVLASANKHELNWWMIGAIIAGAVIIMIVIIAQIKGGA